MSDEFIRIASYTHLWEADLARARLADEQIRAFLGNVTLVSWFWHYSNAAGGVTVHVARRDAEAARRYLVPELDSSHAAKPSWTCPRCKATVAGDWTACWQCGSSTAGGESDRPAGGEAAPGPAPEPGPGYGLSIFALAVIVVIMVVVISSGPLAALAIAPLVVLFIVLFHALGTQSAETAGWLAEPAPERPKKPARHRPPRLRRAKAAARDMVWRAWRSAVLGFFVFPPLGLYSLFLLRRLAAQPFRPTRRATAMQTGTGLCTRRDSDGVVAAGTASGLVVFQPDLAGVAVFQFCRRHPSEVKSLRSRYHHGRLPLMARDVMPAACPRDIYVRR